ncbi:DUF2993 domain-containing protein [Skermania piniformis]|uniref:LmeA family phospholipid-binding protein n=1 Tax=Skermania pinensis TaxID=39122 RepID=A0ABX8S6H6_9ACTN|nr:DUF2993 domain-containing protein [Skermania piniformis]QXQ13450.1 LmeA family phospholipid-binding protein [Skermania piniformis]
MRKLLVVLVGLLTLGVLADFAAATWTEYQVSRQLRAGGRLGADPEVTIHGFPFVVQAAQGRFRNVEIRARGVRTGPLGETRLEANLEGVRFRTADLVDHRVRTVPVDRLYGRVRIDATALGRLFGIPDLQVSQPPDKPPRPAGPTVPDSTVDTLILTGTVPVGGTPVATSVRADVLLENGRVRVIARSIQTDPGGSAEPAVGQSAEAAVLGLFSHEIDTRQLPFGVVPTRVAAEGAQIVVEGKATDVQIDLDQLQSA